MGVMTPQLKSKSVNEHTKNELRNSKDDYYLKTTNIVALCIFLMTITGWIIMNCIYLRRGNIFYSIVQDEYFINITNINNQTIASLPIIRQKDVGLIIWLVLSGTTTFLFLLKTLNYLPKFWAVIGLIVQAVMVVLSLFLIFLYIYAFFFLENVPSKYFLLLVIITTCKMALSPLYTRNLDPIIESLKKTSHVAFSFPSVFLFGLITAILIITVTAFTAVSFYSTDGIVSSIISLLGGIYLVSVIFNFVIEVTNEFAIILKCRQNKEAKPGCIVLKSIGVVIRKEIGFIIIWCTIIVPLILTLFVCCSKKYKQHSHSHFNQARKNFVRSWLISNGLDYVLPLIASHPAGVHEATKKICNLIFVRSYVFVSTFGAVFAAVLCVFCSIGMIISLGVPFAIFQNSLVGPKAFIQIAIMYNGLGIVLLFGVVFATIIVSGSLHEYIIGKEVAESVKRELPHNVGEVSKNCAIDQTQQPNTITDV